MRSITIIYSILLSSSGLFSQGYQAGVVIENLPDGMVYLSQFRETEYKVIDSIESVNGSFYFYLAEHQPQGMYRMDFQVPAPSQHQDGARFIEFIWADETFQVFGDYNDLEGTVQFENSEENRLLQDYSVFAEHYERKMNAIYPMLDRYPEEDDFYREAATYFEKIQEERDAFIIDIVQNNPHLYASRIIDSYRTITIPYRLKGKQRIEFLQQHFFDLSPMDDPALMYAPIYTQKIIEYLKLFRNQAYTFSEQEEAFIRAVDIIMANVSGDIELRKFVVEYLLEGFHSFGMEEAQIYMVDNYVDETCTTDLVELTTQRVIGYRKMAEGQIAEDILIRGADQEMIRLSEVDADYILVIFWAAYCDHCREIIPDFRKWYLEDKPENLEIFAVSIDSVKSDWTDYLAMNDLPWINTHEPMGWEGRSASDYNVYATPTMFLLDRERKIIARPFNMRELRRKIRQMTD
ncbi:MAG: TlpA disulfide reductase family protein [Bacteroidales bacterium]